MKLNFYMQGQAGPYQCGQAMKIGLNTLYFVQENKGRFRTVLLAGVQRPHKMAIRSHRSGTLTLHRKNEWLLKSTIQKSEGKHFTRFCCKGHPPVQASCCVSGNRHKSCGTGVESYRAVLSVWRRKKAHGSTGISGMFPAEGKPEVSCRPKEKGGSATAWSPVLSPDKGRGGVEKAKGKIRHSLKRNGCLPASGTVFIKGNHATGKAVRII